MEPSHQRRAHGLKWAVNRLSGRRRQISGEQPSETAASRVCYTTIRRKLQRVHYFSAVKGAVTVGRSVRILLVLRTDGRTVEFRDTVPQHDEERLPDGVISFGCPVLATRKRDCPGPRVKMFGFWTSSPKGRRRLTANNTAGKCGWHFRVCLFACLLCFLQTQHHLTLLLLQGYTSSCCVNHGNVRLLFGLTLKSVICHKLFSTQGSLQLASVQTEQV